MPSSVPELRPVSRGPRHPTESELRRVGVEIIDESSFLLRCVQCWKVWQPLIRGGGGVFRGYWRCPEGCNADLVQRPSPERRP